MTGRWLLVGRIVTTANSLLRAANVVIRELPVPSRLTLAIILLLLLLAPFIWVAEVERDSMRRAPAAPTPDAYVLAARATEQVYARRRAARRAAAEMVTVTDLAREYESNSIAAEQKHQGQCRTITGAISDIGRDILGTAYVALKPSEAVTSYFLVKVKVDATAKHQLINLHVGQVVEVRRRIGSYTAGVLAVEPTCPVIE